jgi:hypothetical protein
MLLTGCESDALGGLGGKWNSFTDWFKGLVGIKTEDKKSDEPADSGKEDTPSTPEEPEEEPVVIPEIEVKLDVSELPSELLVGEELDFDEYVSVFGTSTPYSVALSDESKEFASLDGHVLTVTGEGSVEYTISVEKESKNGSFATIEELRRDFREFSKTIKDDYVVFHLDYDLDTSRVSRGGAMKHTENYTFDEYFQEDDEGNYIPGGYVEVDEEVYGYIFNEDSELEFKKYGTEPASLSDITGSFSIKPSELSVLHGTEEENGGAGLFSKDALFLPASNANASKVNKLLQGQSDISKYGYSFAGAYIEDFGSLTYVDEETGAKEDRPVFSIVPTFTSSQSTKPSPFIDMLYIVVQDSDVNVVALDEFIASGIAPHGLDFSYFESVINYYASQSSFTLDTEYGCYIDDRALSMYEAYQAGFSGLFYSSTGEVKAYVTPDQIHTEEVGMEYLSFGYVVGEDDKVYSYSYVADEVPQVVVTEPAADVEGGFPAHAIYEMYQGNQMDVQIETLVTETGIIQFAGSATAYQVVTTCTEAEYLTFEQKLEAAGWLIVDKYMDPTSPTDFVLRFGATQALVTLYDYGTYYRITFMIDASLANGHFVAVEDTAETIAGLLPQENYSFLRSDVKIMDPETLVVQSVYEPIFVNDIVTSDPYEYVIDNPDDPENPDVYSLVDETAVFMGRSGNMLLQYLTYLSTPTSQSDYTLNYMIEVLTSYDYLSDAEMTFKVTHLEGDESAILGVTISLRMTYGYMDEEQTQMGYWGFDTTFTSESIPAMDIEFPVQSQQI